MKITKVKLAEKRSRVLIEYETIGEKGQINYYTLNCSDEPLPALEEALSDLLDLVITFCCLDKAAWIKAAGKGDAFVSGVTLKHGDDIGVVITAQLHEPDCPCVTITSPYLKSDYLSAKDYVLIERVTKEATVYIKGDRKTQQLDLLETAA